MSYANKKDVKYIAIIGENELDSGKINLRNMKTGDQKKLPIDKIID